jgi:predicted nucleotidyltransferase
MNVIGIIAEYNPFHNGHLYHLKQIKKKYPQSILILVLNGYFLERGEISVLTKEEKVKIALENNINLVVELPFLYGTQSADTFADYSLQILNELKVNRIIFGSEMNNVKELTKIAKLQLSDNFDNLVKEEIRKGSNYPTTINKVLKENVNKPNDLLAVSYIKAIIKNNYDIVAESIKRTNDYHDTQSTSEIVSASNIREKIKNNMDISKYTAYGDKIVNVNYDLLFKLIKYKILTDNDLNKYLDVDEGIENKLIKEIDKVSNLNDLIMHIKSKRYTYNRLNRMLIHILIGVTKVDNDKELKYIKVLGFDNTGKSYLRKLDSKVDIKRKISDKHISQKYEIKASKIFDLLTSEKSLEFELNNKPIQKD